MEGCRCNLIVGLAWHCPGVTEENPPKVIQCSLNSNGAPPKYKSGALPSRDSHPLANKLHRGQGISSREIEDKNW